MLFCWLNVNIHPCLFVVSQSSDVTHEENSCMFFFLLFFTSTSIFILLNGWGKSQRSFLGASWALDTQKLQRNKWDASTVRCHQGFHHTYIWQCGLMCLSLLVVSGNDAVSPARQKWRGDLRPSRKCLSFSNEKRASHISPAPTCSVCLPLVADQGWQWMRAPWGRTAGPGLPLWRKAPCRSLSRQRHE